MENKEFQTLIISLLLHGLLAWLLIHSHSDFTMPDPNSKPVEFTVVDNDKRSKMAMTPKSLELPEDILERKLHDQAQIVSRLDQRVREQMVARKHDGTTENLGRGNAPTQPSRMSQKLEDLNPFAHDDNRIGGMTSQRAQQASPQSLLGSGGVGRFRAIGDSSSQSSIPGVKEGSFTALNTDQLTFYSFYARVNEAIVHRWISHIRDYVMMLTPAMQQQLAKTPNVTRVEIVLNAKGEYLKAIVHSSSGDTNLDDAAMKPFKEAAPFLNPPQEMPDADGTIHLLYQFTINFY